MQIQLFGRRPLYGDHVRFLKLGQFETVPVGRTVEITVRPHDRRRKLWLTRVECLVPSFVKGEGHLNYISVTNISEQPLTLHEDVIIGMWLAEDNVPRQPGYITIGSRRYIEWQNLAFAATTDLVSEEEPVE